MSYAGVVGPDAVLARWVRWAAGALSGARDAAPEGTLPVARAQVHRVEALLYAALSTAGDSRREDLAAAARATAASNLLLCRALPDVVAPLERAGVRYAVFKGAALVTGHAALRGVRAVSDVDVLVAPGDLRRARTALLDAGFEPDDPALPLSVVWNNERVLVRHRAPAVHVDLHRGFHRAPLFSRLSSLALRTAVRAGDVAVVADAVAPLVIAAHRAKHGFSADARELYDFHFLVADRDASGVDALLGDARRCGIEGALYVVWTVCRAWLGPMHPDAESGYARLCHAVGARRAVLDRLAALDSPSDANKPWRHLAFTKMYLPMPLLTDHVVAPFGLCAVHAALRGTDAALNRVRR